MHYTLSSPSLTDGSPYYASTENKYIVRPINALILTFPKNSVYTVTINITTSSSSTLSTLLSNYYSGYEPYVYYSNIKIILKNTTSSDIFLILPSSLTKYMNNGVTHLYLPASTAGEDSYSILYATRIYYKPTRYNSSGFIVYLYAENVYSPMNYIDLGLPSGTLWADRNLGSTKLPSQSSSYTDLGSWYAWGYEIGCEWGHTVTDMSSDWWVEITHPSGYLYLYNEENLTNIKLEDDLAYEVTNHIGCIPSSTQILELNDYTNKEVRTNSSGIKYIRYTNINDNTKYIDFQLSSDHNYWHDYYPYYAGKTTYGYWDTTTGYNYIWSSDFIPCMINIGGNTTRHYMYKFSSSQTYMEKEEIFAASECNIRPVLLN